MRGWPLKKWIARVKVKGIFGGSVLLTLWTEIDGKIREDDYQVPEGEWIDIALTDGRGK